MLDNIEAQVGGGSWILQGARWPAESTKLCSMCKASASHLDSWPSRCGQHCRQHSHCSPPAAQVAKSVEYVQAGTTHLVAAKRLQKNTRKWMCCALILLIIIAAAIAIPIALKLTK